MANSKIRLTAAYENTTYTRDYEFDIEDEFIPTAKQKIKDLNASLQAHTDDGFDEFFVGNNGEKLVTFKKAQLITINETVLDLESGE